MRLKRVFDIVVSAGVLMLLFPLLIVIAALVWVESGRPVFFSQERIGLGFRRFRIWKFRSMRPNDCGPAVTVAGDCRVTRLGAVLRAAKLDELPQFWNVLKGDMSLVGPRPEVPQYVELYRERYAGILAVRPGITDLASIAFRHEEQVLARSSDPELCYRDTVLPAKLALAEQYVRRQSFARDLRILIGTLAVLAHGSAQEVEQ